MAAAAAAAGVGTSILDELITEEMVEQKTKPDWANIATIKRLVMEGGFVMDDNKVSWAVLYLLASAFPRTQVPYAALKVMRFASAKNVCVRSKLITTQEILNRDSGKLAKMWSEKFKSIGQNTELSETLPRVIALQNAIKQLVADHPDQEHQPAQTQTGAGAHGNGGDPPPESGELIVKVGVDAPTHEQMQLFFTTCNCPQLYEIFLAMEASQTLCTMAVDRFGWDKVESQLDMHSKLVSSMFMAGACATLCFGAVAEVTSKLLTPGLDVLTFTSAFEHVVDTLKLEPIEPGAYTLALESIVRYAGVARDRFKKCSEGEPSPSKRQRLGTDQPNQIQLSLASVDDSQSSMVALGLSVEHHKDIKELVQRFSTEDTIQLAILTALWDDEPESYAQNQQVLCGTHLLLYDIPNANKVNDFTLSQMRQVIPTAWVAMLNSGAVLKWKDFATPQDASLYKKSKDNGHYPQTAIFTDIICYGNWERFSLLYLYKVWIDSTPDYVLQMTLDPVRLKESKAFATSYSKKYKFPIVGDRPTGQNKFGTVDFAATAMELWMKMMRVACHEDTCDTFEQVIKESVNLVQLSPASAGAVQEQLSAYLRKLAQAQQVGTTNGSLLGVARRRDPAEILVHSTELLNYMQVAWTTLKHETLRQSLLGGQSTGTGSGNTHSSSSSSQRKPERPAKRTTDNAHGGSPAKSRRQRGGSNTESSSSDWRKCDLTKWRKDFPGMCANKFFQSFGCKKGDACQFSHDGEKFNSLWKAVGGEKTFNADKYVLRESESM